MCGSPEKTLPPLCASTHTRVSDDGVLRDKTHRIKELKHCRSNQQHHMRTSNEHTAPTSACNTARDTRNGVLQTPQLHVVLGELRENYKQYLSPFSLSLSSDLFMFLKYCLRCLGFKARRAGLCSLLILPLACKLFLSGFKYNLSYVYDIICNIYDNEPGVAILRSCFVLSRYQHSGQNNISQNPRARKTTLVIWVKPEGDIGSAGLREVPNWFYAHAVLDVMLKECVFY